MVAEFKWRGFPTAEASKNNTSLTKKVGRRSGNEIQVATFDVSSFGMKFASYINGRI